MEHKKLFCMGLVMDLRSGGECDGSRGLGRGKRRILLRVHKWKDEIRAE